MSKNDSKLLTKVSPLIEGQVPDFVQADHSLFVEFVKDYFEFLECAKLTVTGTIHYIRQEVETTEYILLEDGERIITETADGSISQFTVGETITGGTSKATATVLVDDSRNNSIFVSSQQKFILNETLTGSTSGSTATLTLYQANPVQNIQQLLEYANVDNTIDQFLDQFRKQFMASIPNTLASGVSKRNLVKSIKDLYTAKGTSEANKLFFRVLVDQIADVFYPNENMLKLSKGNFRKVPALRLVATSSDISGDEIFGTIITGETSTATGLVESVTSSSDAGVAIVEVGLEEISGTFQTGETVTATSVSRDVIVEFTVQTIVTDLTITNDGILNAPLQKIAFENLGDGSVDARVETVSAGSVNGLIIDDAGSGYAVNDTLVFTSTVENDVVSNASGFVSSVGDSGEITGVTLTNNGGGYSKLPTITITTTSGSGGKILATTTTIGRVETIQFTDLGSSYSETNPPDATFLANFVLKNVTGTFAKGNTLTSNDHVGVVDSFNSNTNVLTTTFENVERIAFENDTVANDNVQLESEEIFKAFLLESLEAVPGTADDNIKLEISSFGSASNEFATGGDLLLDSTFSTTTSGSNILLEDGFRLLREDDSIAFIENNGFNLETHPGSESELILEDDSGRVALETGEGVILVETDTRDGFVLLEPDNVPSLTLVGSVEHFNTEDNTITLDVSSIDIQENDLIIVALKFRGNEADQDISVTNFEPDLADLFVDSSDNPDLNAGVFFKVATGDETELTATTNTTSSVNSIVAVFRNVKTSNPIDGSAATNTATGATLVTPPNITTTRDKSIIVQVVFADGAGTIANFGAPVGSQNLIEQGASFNKLAIATSIQETLGTTSLNNFGGGTTATDDSSAAVTFAIRLDDRLLTDGRAPSEINENTLLLETADDILLLENEAETPVGRPRQFSSSRFRIDPPVTLNEDAGDTILIDALIQSSEGGRILLDGTDSSGTDAGDLLLNESFGEDNLILEDSESNGKVLYETDELGGFTIILDGTDTSGTDAGDNIILESGIDFTNNDVIITDSSGASGTIVNADITTGATTCGALSTGSGSYVNELNLLGEDYVRVQDSNFYQDFSYEIIVEAAFSDYINELKNSIHPAGFKPFGRFSDSRLVSAKVEVAGKDIIDYTSDTTKFSPILGSLFDINIQPDTRGEIILEDNSGRVVLETGGGITLESATNIGVQLTQDIVIDVETNPTPRKNPDNLLLHLAKPFIQPSSIELEIGDGDDEFGNPVFVSGNLVLDGDVPFTKQGEIVLEDGTQELRGYNNLLLEDNGSVDLELGTDIGDINIQLEYESGKIALENEIGSVTLETGEGDLILEGERGNLRQQSGASSGDTGDALGDNLILESPETYFTAFRQSSQNTFTEGDGDRILLESDDNEGTLTFENVGTIEFQSVLREDKLGSNQEQANANAESSTGLLLENFGRLILEDTTGNLRLETNDTIQLEDTGFLVVESTSTYHDDVSILLETDTPIKVDGILLEDNDGFDVNYQQNIIILESGSGGDLLVLEDALREDILLNSRISLENGGKLLSEKANIAGSRANSGQQPLENFTLNSRTNPLGATPVTRPADILIKSI